MPSWPIKGGPAPWFELPVNVVVEIDIVPELLMPPPTLLMAVLSAKVDAGERERAGITRSRRCQL